jgi:hypothetical protein
MMGADGEFERRQAELTHLFKLSAAEDSSREIRSSSPESPRTKGSDMRGSPRKSARKSVWTPLHGSSEATDDDVVWSTIESVGPGGFMREYIELGQLAHAHGNCLYVHGGIVGGGCGPDEHAVGAMPMSDERIEDVHEWVAALNAWKDAQVSEWISNPLWSGEGPAADVSEAIVGHEANVASVASVDHGPATRWKTCDGYTLTSGGQALQDYGLFTTDGPTVVLGRHLQKTGMPMGVPDEAMATLNKGGIRRVVVGHTPHGTCPTIIKTGGPGMEEPGLVVVMADTSYSDMKAPDNRGRAVSEVLLLDNGQVCEPTRWHHLTRLKCTCALCSLALAPLHSRVLVIVFRCMCMGGFLI